MLNISQLDFAYRYQTIYQGFSLALDTPGIYGLFGRNGSGKSTLLKIISGLLFPERGKVNVLGYQPQARQPGLLEQLYLIPEEFHLPDITLATLEKNHAPFYPNFSNSDFKQYVEIFEVPSAQRFSAMSLGQKKKAVLAFALATHTPLLLMDEPTNGLDIIGRGQFKSVLSRPEHANRLVIISTHQAHDLESLLNHVLFVDHGQLVLSASMAKLQQRLTVGISDDLAQIACCIYHEVIGQQFIFVAQRQQQPVTPINLELLYKALSLNQVAVLAALQEVEHA